MEERKKTQVADMDRGVYDIKNNFEYSYIADAGLTEISGIQLGISIRL
mgnify:CR=1 FL=1